jgi:Cytidine and deoxycytidylate deaminase zinc-binding region
MDFAQRAIDLARQNVAEGGRPFATVIAKNGEILAESANKVAQTHDPTAHAERRLPMRHDPPTAALDVYRVWWEGNDRSRTAQ